MPVAPTLTRRLILAQWRAHPGRTLITALAIAIGVAMGFAVYLINHSALTEFTQATRLLSGQADLQIRGPARGFDEALYPALARLPQVAVASPVVEREVRVTGHPGALTVLGLDVFRAAQVSADLVGQPARSDAGQLVHLDPAAVFLSRAAAAWLDLAPDDTLSLESDSGPVRLRVAGTLPAADSSLRLAVMDIGAAQWRFGTPGRLQRIDLRLRRGVDTSAFRQQLAPLLPPGVIATTPQDRHAATADLSRAYRVNLNVLALMALFTGSFLVFSSQVLATEARRSQFALLRALGMTRGALLRMLLAEGLLLGLSGSVLGIALGAAIAQGALQHLGPDLGGGYFAGAAASLQLSLPGMLTFAGLGLAAALLGSYVPARTAARTPPAPALKADGGPGPSARPPRGWVGWPWMIAGLALTQAPPLLGLPLPAYLAIGLMLIGAILWMPWISAHLLRRLPASRQPVWHLAVAQLAATPQRTAIALSSILVSFSLMTAMVIMVDSFRTSFEDWLDVVLPAQVYVRTPTVPGGARAFTPAERSTLAATPGVARAEFMQTDQVMLDPHLPPVALILRPIDPHDPGKRLSLVRSIPIPAGAPPVAWVSEAMVDLYHMQVGQDIRIPLEGVWRHFTIAGVWRDYARQFGAIVVNTADAERFPGVVRATEAALWPSADTSAAQLIAALHGRLPQADLEYRSSGEIRATSLRIFDRSFAITYLLEAVAIAVGLFGVGVCLGAQVLARAREFGMLRHLGVTRGQISRMLTLEGMLLGGLGVVAGLLLGGAIAWILVEVVNPQSFHWTMTMVLPWRPLAAAALALIATAGLTARIAGWRALSTEPVRAVRDDW